MAFSRTSGCGCRQPEGMVFFFLKCSIRTSCQPEHITDYQPEHASLLPAAIWMPHGVTKCLHLGGY